MRWIVLLRAVNVGGTGKLPMAPLRAALTEAGAANVASYIQSGNLVLDLDREDPQAVADWTCEVIAAHVGFRPEAVALSLAELRAAREALPFAGTDPKMTHLGFFRGTPAQEAPDRLVPFCTQGEELALGPLCLWMYTPKGIGRSKLAGKIDGALGLPVTLRNLNTVEALLALG
ncbi:DUF1697 domain-containing protein [Oceanicola sp. S124]|uniref:DUF1697 domain-containing protein n=1 Tax=Oceanicola sp. S124 TaxID=1042378 RepID=UPI0002558D29|nr:DUF1697 domain-containing protein [Oceanicola sp. S124]